MERGRIQGLSKFWGYPLLSQEWVKLRTSNLSGTFTGPIRKKPIKNFGENGVWAYPGTAQILASCGRYIFRNFRPKLLCLSM